MTILGLMQTVFPLANLRIGDEADFPIVVSDIPYEDSIKFWNKELTEDTLGSICKRFLDIIYGVKNSHVLLASKYGYLDTDSCTEEHKEKEKEMTFQELEEQRKRMTKNELISLIFGEEIHITCTEVNKDYGICYKIACEDCEYLDYGNQPVEWCKVYANVMTSDCAEIKSIFKQILNQNFGACMNEPQKNKTHVEWYSVPRSIIHECDANLLDVIDDAVTNGFEIKFTSEGIFCRQVTLEP